MGRVRCLVVLAVLGLATCASDEPAPVDPVAYAYSDWLYDPYDWYDDPFWIWVDDHPDCCPSGDDLKEAAEDWWNGLDPDEQDQVRDRADQWLDDHGLEPAPGQTRRDLILDTAADRWEALSPEDRQAWLADREQRIEQRRSLEGQLSSDQQAELRSRIENTTPEQRAAARERLSERGWSGPGSLDATEAGRDRLGGRDRFRSMTFNHPMPSRAGLQRAPRFGGGGRLGGRGRR